MSDTLFVLSSDEKKYHTSLILSTCRAKIKILPPYLDIGNEVDQIVVVEERVPSEGEEVEVEAGNHFLNMPRI